MPGGTVQYVVIALSCNYFLLIPAFQPLPAIDDNCNRTVIMQRHIHMRLKFSGFHF
jgi:hypothetical protein